MHPDDPLPELMTYQYKDPDINIQFDVMRLDFECDPSPPCDIDAMERAIAEGRDPCEEVY